MWFSFGVCMSFCEQNSFAHHGLVWFALTDFVPFCVGGSAFMLVMVTGSSKKRGDVEHEGIPDSDAAQSLLPSSSKGSKPSGDIHSKRSRFLQTPKQGHDNVVDSDIDNTPQTPEDDLTPLRDEEMPLGSRRRAYSYDANSSVTTNSPFYGQRNQHNEFSPQTPSQQRWMSFNSSSMLPSSLSPAGGMSYTRTHDTDLPPNPHHTNNNNTFNPHRPFKSMSNLRHLRETGNAYTYTPPSQSTVSPESCTQKNFPAPVARQEGRGVVSQKQATAAAVATGGNITHRTGFDESKVISTLSCNDFISENNSEPCNDS